MPAELLVVSPSMVDGAALPAALARMDRVLATILELAPSAVRVVDVSGRIVRTNARALAGHPAPQPVTVRELWERDQPRRVNDKALLGFLDTPGMRALAGIATRGERLAVRHASGGADVIECDASPVVGDDGKVIGAVIIDREVGDERPRDDAGVRVEPRAVAEVAQAASNKGTEGAGRSASVLVHDVNNSLNTIMAAAFLVQHRADSPDAVKDYAGRIQQAAESGAAAVRLVERMVREAPNRGDGSSTSELSPKRMSARVSEISGPLDILLVEDNPDGREFISRVLRAEGHRVDAVATVAEARMRLESMSSSAVDLLLTDLELPDGNGLELAAYAKGQRASLRIGVISGWDVSIGGDDASGAEFVLRKPLRSAELLDHVAGRQAPALPE